MTTENKHDIENELNDTACYADNLIGSIHGDHVRLHSQFGRDEWFIKISNKIELWEYPLSGEGKPRLNAEYDTAEEAYKEGSRLA